MNRTHPFILVCLFALASTAAAQPTQVKKPEPTKPIAANAVASKDPEAERARQERRAQAQSLLISLAADAGSYNDQKLRGRTQARIADVLWDSDPDRARALFRKAWDAAEIVDQENRGPLVIDMTKPLKGGAITGAGPSNVRGEILRMAARRDRALGEELLAKLKVDKAREATEAADKGNSHLFDSPDGVTQRLSLARQLLATDVERALQFADPALTTITRDAIDFLSYLREKDAAAADQRYSGLLAMAGSSMQSDANTVSLLSSYLFTPHTYVAFNGTGGANTQTSRGSEPPVVAPGLRNAFFRSAAAILLRPQPPPGQDQTSAGPQGKYLMIKRLLPLFEQFAPKETTDAMRAQMEALGSIVPEDLRERDDDTMREGIRPRLSSDDREKSLLDRIDRVKTSEERDGLYVQLAMLRAENGDLKARDYVDKVDDSEMRRNVRAYLDVTLTMRALDKKDIEQVLELVRTGELTHLQKAWALALAAKLLAKTDHDKALAVIEEAAAEARRIEGSDADRPRALMAVANALLVNDRGKTWDATYDAVKAANSAEGFTGEDGVLRISMFTKVIASTRTSSAPDFDVSTIFAELAKDDYNRTVELARGFEREAPRASAVMAIARAVLDDKDKPNRN